MDNNEIYMNIPAVETIANGFANAARILEAVNKTLYGLMILLRTVAFMGLVGGYAVERYIQWLRPKIDYMAEYCEEISSDIKFAIEAYINGDEAGALRFH